MKKVSIWTKFPIPRRPETRQESFISTATSWRQQKSGRWPNQSENCLKISTNDVLLVLYVICNLATAIKSNTYWSKGRLSVFMYLNVMGCASKWAPVKNWRNKSEFKLALLMSKISSKAVTTLTVVSIVGVLMYGVMHRWARGVATPCSKKIFMTPTPSEMAFDPLPGLSAF